MISEAWRWDELSGSAPATMDAAGNFRSRSRMDTTGFNLSLLLLLLSGQALAFKSCDNCLPVTDCRRWCTKLELGFSSLSLEERKEYSDNLCGFLPNSKDAKLCCDTPAEKAACTKKKVELKKEPQQQLEPFTAGPKEPKCGQILVEGEVQIAGGDDVSSPGAWPWVARILYQANFDSAANNQTTYCGGALVSARHVVTAAHCVETEPVAVDLGEVDVTTEYDCNFTEEECGANGSEGEACFAAGRCAAKRERYNVKSWSKHPDYKKKSGSGKHGKPVCDVAVLVLDRPVQFTTNIQPVCLPSSHSQPKKGSTSRTLVLKGWGNIVKGIRAPKSATVLQELRGVQETPLDQCRVKVGHVASLESHHMCVWKEGSGSNGCKGDSGGPVSELIRKGLYDKGSWDLAGVVSFGVSRACGANAPLVVTRVSEPSILNWIKERVGKDLPYRP